MNKLISIFAGCAAITCCFTACTKDDFGVKEGYAVESFDALWNDLDENYALFFAHNVDWQALYNQYRPKVNENTKNSELWPIVTEMLKNLDDVHTQIADPKAGTGFSSGDPNSLLGYEFQSQLDWITSVVQSKYLSSFNVVFNNDNDGMLAFGRIKDSKTGYIMMTNVLDAVGRKMPAVLSELQDCDKIILDLRATMGGLDDACTNIAGLFADSEQLIYTVQTRNGKGHDDLSAKKSYSSKKVGSTQYTKPLIVLTSNITVSAAEVLLIHLKSFAQTIQVGDYTSGNLSDIGPVKTLPNGWVYAYSTMRYLLPDGTSLDGVGHKPDYEVINTDADVKANTDRVLETAINLVKE